MSGLVASVPLLDTTAAFRNLTVARLQAYGVLSSLAPAGAPLGVPCEAERMDPLDWRDLPRIVVLADEQATLKSQGGGAPSLAITANVVIQCLSAQARKDDALAEIDAMIAQVKDCLLRDPAWTAAMWRLQEIRTQRSFRPENALVIGDGRLLLTCELGIVTYSPRVTVPLSGVDFTASMPGARPGAAPAPAPSFTTATFDL